MPAAVAVPAIVAAGSALLGAKSSKDATKAANEQQQKAIEAAKMDPQLRSMLYGDGGANKGLLSQVPELANRPQSAGMAAFGTGMDEYMKNSGVGAFGASQAAAQGLQSSNFAAPQMQAAQASAASPFAAAQNGVNPRMEAARINAPGQNSTDLSRAFEDKIYGNSAENPYLTGAIQKGINQSTTAFQNLQSDATKNLTENVLPQLRSNSIMSGTLGGTRQGIAEGKAVSSFSDQMGRAASQVGQNNTDAAVSAQAGAFAQGQDRSLSAMGNLNANQFGVAGQNAGFQQQAGSQNASQGLNNGQFNAGLLQQGGLANMGNQQQANMANAGFNQQANANNQQAGMSTNALNSGNIASGIGLSNGLLGSAYNYGQAQDNRDLTRLDQATGLLGRFDKGGGQVAQPYYSNTAGAAMGGAMTGLGMYNQFKDAFGSPPPRNDGMGTGNNYNYQPSQLPINTGLLQNLNFGVQGGK